MNTSEKMQSFAAEEMQEEADDELVRRFIGGDEPSFAKIVRRYEAKIFGVAKRILRNHADAEEITQDTFVRAHRGLANFRGDSALGTWLQTIAMNLARNRYWYFFRRCRHLTLSLDSPIGNGKTATLADLFSSASPDPAREKCKGEFEELIAACMNNLSASHRAILILRSSKNFSYEEIANQLGVCPGTVKSRIARARECLRACLAAACPEFGPTAPVSEWFEQTRASNSLASPCS